MRKLRHIWSAILIVPLLVSLSSCNGQSEPDLVKTDVRTQELPPEPLPPNPPENHVECDQKLERSPMVVILPNVGGYISVNRHLLDLPPGSVKSPTQIQMTQPEATYVLVQVTHDQAIDPGPILQLSATHCSQRPIDDLKVMYFNQDSAKWFPAGTPAPLRVGGDAEFAREPAAAVRVEHLTNYALAAAD